MFQKNLINDSKISTYLLSCHVPEYNYPCFLETSYFDKMDEAYLVEMYLHQTRKPGVIPRKPENRNTHMILKTISNHL